MPQKDAGTIVVSGYMAVGGSIIVDGNVQAAGQIAANSLASITGNVGAFGEKDRIQKVDHEPTPAPVEAMGKYTGDAVKQASLGVYQDAYIMDNEFKFPTSQDYGIPGSLRVPLMLWQTRTLSDKKWKELPVKGTLKGDEDKSYCYPGEVWEIAKLANVEYREDNLKDAYGINVK